MNSRWSREPRLLGGKAAVARITSNDMRLLQMLAKYRYLQILLQKSVEGHPRW
jgi:hypothetical protein